jgi:hypothetical protein
MIHPEELQNIPLFKCLTDPQRQRLAANVAELNVQAGEWIIYERRSKNRPQSAA